MVLRGHSNRYDPLSSFRKRPTNAALPPLLTALCLCGCCELGLLSSPRIAGVSVD